MKELTAYREEFPVLERKAYLISASLGPVSTRAQRYLQEYMEAWATEGAPDPVWMEHIFPRMGALKRTFAGMVGADPSELDFPTDGHVWLAQQRRGAEVVWLPSPDGLTVPLESYAEAIDERTAAVCINRVLYRSSTLVDAKEICRMAREVGAWSVVDDFHGAGIIPVDVHDLGCDFYTTGVLKWLLGGPGVTFLYARASLLPELEPAITGWMAQREPFMFDVKHLDLHPSARKLETGTPPAPITFIAQGGLDIVTEVTPERIRPRIGELTDHVIAGADQMGLPVRTLRDRNARGGLVNVKVGDQARKICHALLDRDVCTDHRGDGLRISPHFFNTEDDVDRLFRELRDIL